MQDSTFSPTLINVTYNLSRNLVCDYIWVDQYCFNITGGSDAYNYCNVTGYIYIPSAASPVIDTFEPYLNQTISEIWSYEFNITVNDTDGFDVNWYVNGSNQTTAWDSLTFDFIGNYSAEGTYNITVNVSDGGGSDSQSWIITLINAPYTGGGTFAQPPLIILSSEERCDLINGTWMIENEAEYCTLEPKEIKFIESLGFKIWPSFPRLGFILGCIVTYFLLGILIELCKVLIIFREEKKQKGSKDEEEK